MIRRLRTEWSRPYGVGGRAVYTLLSLLSVLSLGVLAWEAFWSGQRLGPFILVMPSLLALNWLLLLRGYQRAGTILLFVTSLGLSVTIAVLRGHVAGEPFVQLILLLITVGLVMGSRAALIGGIVAATAAMGMSALIAADIVDGEAVTLEPTVATFVFYAVSLLLITLMLVVGIRSNEALVETVEEMNGALTNELAERGRMAAALAASEAELAAVLAGAPIGVITAGSDGRIVRVDGAIAGRVAPGCSELGALLAPDDLAAVQDRLDELRAGAASVAPMEVRIESGGAEAMDCRMHFGLVAQAGADGTGTERTILMVEDVTEQRRFERRLLAEQRHHHMGLIAGRLAHDFNNLMAAVLAQATVAGDRASRGLATGEQIDQVKVGARAAAALTGQLVSYAGNAPQARQVLDLGAVIGTVRELFEVTLPPGVDLVTGLAPDTPPVAADEGQLQQVIMNLLINAAQAMSGRRGTVQLNTRCVEGDPVELETWNIAGADLRPGRYAVAEVIDEGTGIAPDVLARMWDPFFTTAEDGHGLGLSVVRGIVRSHGGALRVTTRQGVGTTVGFVLPAAARPPHIDAPDTRLID